MIAGGLEWISQSNCSVVSPPSEEQHTNRTFHHDSR